MYVHIQYKYTEEYMYICIYTQIRYIYIVK